MMSGDNDSIVNNPLFGALIGQQIGNNAYAEANQIASDTRVEGAKSIAKAGVVIATQLRSQLDRSNDIAWNLMQMLSIGGMKPSERKDLIKAVQKLQRSPLTSNSAPKRKSPLTRQTVKSYWI